MTVDAPSPEIALPDLQEPSGTELPAQATGNAVRRESYSVLVIDDDADFQDCVSSILRENGFTVLTAGSGIRGLDMLDSGPCCVRVVLLDYTMPVLDGTQTLQYLRNLFPGIKVVAVTGSSAKSVAPDFRGGVDAYINKPLNTQELIKVIDRLAVSAPRGY